MKTNQDVKENIIVRWIQIKFGPQKHHYNNLISNNTGHCWLLCFTNSDTKWTCFVIAVSSDEYDQNWLNGGKLW